MYTNASMPGDKQAMLSCKQDTPKSSNETFLGTIYKYIATLLPPLYITMNLWKNFARKLH